MVNYFGISLTNSLETPLENFLGNCLSSYLKNSAGISWRNSLKDSIVYLLNLFFGKMFEEFFGFLVFEKLHWKRDKFLEKFHGKLLGNFLGIFLGKFLLNSLGKYLENLSKNFLRSYVTFI